MTQVPRVLLDASVWIAGAGSASGGSAVLVEMGLSGKIRIVSSRLLLLEAERNIQTKLPRKALLRFYKYVSTVDILIVEAPEEEDIVAQMRIIHPKDAHVLATAVKSRVDYLLTLDRRDFMTSKVLGAAFPFEIMTPGDFLRSWIER